MTIIKNAGVGWKTKHGGIYVSFKKPLQFRRIVMTPNPAKKTIHTDPIMRGVQRDMPDYILTAIIDEPINQEIK
jgi:hypothetical protein